MSVTSTPASAATRPNILWICTDQQRYDTIGALGNPHVHTPHIDRLVREGVAFTHAHCQAPICTPSRASFLTGLYPSTMHACMNGNDEWAEAAPLVTKLLADAGYDGGLSGKLHLSAASGRIERRAPEWDGYRVFQWSHDPVDRWPAGHAYADWLRGKGYVLGDLRKNPAEVPPELHQTTWCTNVALEFITQQRPPETPWFFSLNCFDPHPPFDPPAEYLRRFEPAAMPGPLFRDSDLAAQAAIAAAGVNFQTPVRRPEEFAARRIQAAYYAMIEQIDDNVGRLLDALERTGQRDTTLIIFTSDHGEALGDHGLLQKGCRFYEGLVRVPLIVSWSGDEGRRTEDEGDSSVLRPPSFVASLAGFRRGLASDALVELTDIVPTLLDVAGLKYPRRMHGRSLLPILTGRADPHHHRDLVRSEFYGALGPRDDPDDPYQRTGSYATMVRDRRHKLVVYHGAGTGELFDLEANPGEFQNCWAAPEAAAVKTDLLRRSLDAMAFAVDPGPPRTAGF
jgi:arylsulfatase A-like enzyme